MIYIESSGISIISMLSQYKAEPSKDLDNNHIHPLFKDHQGLFSYFISFRLISESQET